MKTICKISAMACLAFSMACTNRTANSEDNNNESHLGTDIQRMDDSKNDSLPSPDVARTSVDTAAPQAEGNATEAAQKNPTQQDPAQQQPDK